MCWIYRNLVIKNEIQSRTKIYYKSEILLQKNKIQLQKRNSLIKKNEISCGNPTCKDDINKNEISGVEYDLVLGHFQDTKKHSLKR